MTAQPMPTPVNRSSPLQIQDARERALVRAADRVLSVGSRIAGAIRRRQLPSNPERILLLRLERIGDLLMALPAIADVRALAPDATIDLVVGSWNRELAGAIASVSSVRTLDAAWLARENGGLGGVSLLKAARERGGGRYDFGSELQKDTPTKPF